MRRSIAAPFAGWFSSSRAVPACVLFIIFCYLPLRAYCRLRLCCKEIVQ
ncbi:F-box protein [Acidovorax sp. Root217]